MGLLNLINPILFKNRITELTYFTTDACNFSCKHCFMVKHFGKQADTLTVSEIVKMGKHIKSMQRVHLGGGEPFIKDDIADKALIVSNQWNSLVTCIPTNGWFTDNIALSIEKLGINAKNKIRIHFSINSMGKEMDHFCAKEGAFNKWESSINRALNISRKFDNTSIVGLVTFGDYNENHFMELRSFLLDKIKVDDFSFQLFRKNDRYTSMPNIDHFEGHILDFFQNKCAQNPYLVAYRELVRKYSAVYCLTKKQLTPCYAGKTRAVMSPNGNIYPCETLGYPNGNKQNDWLMGNIRDFDYNINELLQSKKAEELVTRIKQQKCHCDHGIDLAFNLLCNNLFKIKVAIRGTKYLLKRCFS